MSSDARICGHFSISVDSVVSTIWRWHNLVFSRCICIFHLLPLSRRGAVDAFSSLFSIMGGCSIRELSHVTRSVEYRSETEIYSSRDKSFAPFSLSSDRSLIVDDLVHNMTTPRNSPTSHSPSLYSTRTLFRKITRDKRTRLVRDLQFGKDTVIFEDINGTSSSSVTLNYSTRARIVRPFGRISLHNEGKRQHHPLRSNPHWIQKRTLYHCTTLSVWNEAGRSLQDPGFYEAPHLSRKVCGPFGLVEECVDALAKLRNIYGEEVKAMGIQ